MEPVVVTDPSRTDLDASAKLGVATVHDALVRSGYLGPDLRPRKDGARIGGRAVTCCAGRGIT